MSNLYHAYQRALAGAEAPALFVDLDAFDRNIHWVKAHCGPKKIRVATKSLHCVDLIRHVLSSADCFRGLMTFTLAESLWLRSLGFSDILMGYPTTDRRGLVELARAPGDITLMVDRPEHLDLLEGIAAEESSQFDICVDVDLSLDLPGARFGVYRSSIQAEADLSRLLDHLEGCPHLKLRGLMGYEAQIAGVGDRNSFLMRLLKKISLPNLRRRRANLAKLIRDRGHELSFVNGGGTGSLLETTKEEVVTEVTVGSGFYSPGLFDNYQAFRLRPAMAFSLPVVRRLSRNIYTALGGGYIASGEVGPSKQPLPFLPEGVKLLRHEGAGEVQTPFSYSGTGPMEIGDLIFMRHAKAGEACERFNQIHLIEGEALKGLVPTYRGEGKAFL